MDRYLCPINPSVRVRYLSVNVFMKNAHSWQHNYYHDNFNFFHVIPPDVDRFFFFSTARNPERNGFATNLSIGKYHSDTGKTNGIGKIENDALIDGFTVFPAYIDTSMRDSDGEISPQAAGTLDGDIKVGIFGRCRRRCAVCMRRLRLPRWIKRPLLLLYTWLGGALTYAILITVVYTSIMSLRPPVALPPKCRRMAVPKYTPASLDSVNFSTTNLPTAQMQELASGNDLPSGFTVALECRQGEALSVLVFYAFGFIVGEVMEMLHLPGLFGKWPSILR